MTAPDPTDQREWWRENWQHSKSWETCTRCGVLILKSHLADGVCRDREGCNSVLARRPVPFAMTRTPDGSTVVAYEPRGLEVRAFGREDLDENGMPRWLR